MPAESGKNAADREGLHGDPAARVDGNLVQVSSLVEEARSFGVVLAECRKRAARADFEWYPYDSLTNIPNLDALIGGVHGYVLESAREERILDLGCGDGDLAFFFESLGYKV